MQIILTEEEYKTLKEQDTRQIETKIEERIGKFRVSFTELLTNNKEIFENPYTRFKVNDFCKRAAELINNI